jgi:hypothetical protein
VQIEHRDNRSGAISAELQVLACLGYLASNSFQLLIGDSLGLSQQSVSNCVYAVTTALSTISGQFIKFQQSDEVGFNVYFY